MYNILKYNGSFLEIVAKNIDESKLDEYGIKDREVFYNDEVVGYILLKGVGKFYAIKGCK